MALTKANVAALQQELEGGGEDGGALVVREGDEAGSQQPSEEQIFQAPKNFSIPPKEAAFLEKLYKSCSGEKWRHKEGWDTSQTPK